MAALISVREDRDLIEAEGERLVAGENGGQNEGESDRPAERGSQSEFGGDAGAAYEAYAAERSKVRNPGTCEDIEAGKEQDRCDELTREVLP